MNRRLSTGRLSVHPDGRSGARSCAAAPTAARHANTTRLRGLKVIQSLERRGEGHCKHMDKGRKEMVSTADIMTIFSDKTVRDTAYASYREDRQAKPDAKRAAKSAALFGRHRAPPGVGLFG